MKVAYDHAKKWFKEIKAILEKEEENFLDPSLNITMREAKAAATSEKNKPCTLIKLMYNKIYKRNYPKESLVDEQDFKRLIKLVKDVSIPDSVTGDMFLTYAKKLGQPAPVKKPDDPKLNDTLGRTGKSLNFNSTQGRTYQ